MCSSDLTVHNGIAGAGALGVLPGAGRDDPHPGNQAEAIPGDETDGQGQACQQQHPVSDAVAVSGFCFQAVVVST